MKSLKQLSIYSIAIMALISCSESGQSHSGAGNSAVLEAQKAQQSISCERIGDRKVGLGETVNARFTFATAYSGTATLTTLCDLQVLSVSERELSAVQLEVSSELATQCGGFGTFSLALSITNSSRSPSLSPNEAQTVGICSWSQHIVSPIIEADIRQQISQ